MPDLPLRAAAQAVRARISSLRAQRWFPDAPRALSAVLVVLIAVEAGRAARLLLPHEASKFASVRPMPVALSSGHIDVAAIVANHLFGIAPDAVTDPRNIAADSHADSHASWILPGTMAAADSRRDGLAIMANEVKPPALYRIGEPVEAGVRLVEVFADRVVLLRSGIAETVWMTKKSSNGPARASAFAGGDEERRFGRSIKLTHGVRDRENPIEPPASPLIFKLRVVSVVVDDHLLGYTALMSGGLLQGLPSRAIVTQINGVDLVDGQAAARMFESLSGGGTATFTIRDGDGDAQKQISVDASGVPGALVLRKNAPPG
jgi:type II secretory pathway component PulC